MSRSKSVKISPAIVTRPGEFRGSLMECKVGEMLISGVLGTAIVVEKLDNNEYLIRQKNGELEQTVVWHSKHLFKFYRRATKLEKLLAGLDNEN